MNESLKDNTELRKPKLIEITRERPSFPKDVVVETICKCNLQCTMCPYPDLKRAKGVMSDFVWKKIVDEVVETSPESNIWVAIMGEPLLADNNLIQKLKYAKSKSFENIHLNTNAVYLSPQLTEELLACNISNVTVSMDAFTEETYNKIRVGGDFESVKKNIQHFLKRKEELNLKQPNVVMQFIVMDENESELDDFKNYWITRGAMVKARLKMGWGEAVETKDLINSGIERDFPCPWLLRTVSIHWTGDFAQCDADHEGLYSPGNILNNSIKEIWDREIKSRVDRHLKLDFDFEPCKNCHDWSVGRSTYFSPSVNQA